MKFLLSILFLSGFALNLSGQNLVLNGDVETITGCPSQIDMVESANPWYSPTNNTPDLFNNCSLTCCGVPQNNFGFQNTVSGYGYLGFSLFNIVGTGREYLTCKIQSPLISQKKYCLSFNVSLSNLWSNSIAVDRLGVYFSNNNIFWNTVDIAPVTPQLQTQENIFYSDTINWMSINFEYIANGGEQYITIGNFIPFSSVNYQAIDSFSVISYYYLDDVSLICCDADSCILNLPAVIPNVFTPDNDGVNDVFKIENLAPNSSLTIYNRWGNTVYQSTNYQNNWDGNNCPAGVYYYILSPPAGKQAKGTVTILKN
jgi:gliding motility-associated-like protein